MGIHFTNTAYLYSLLVILPAVAGLWWLSLWRRRKARKHYGEEDLVNRYTRKRSLFIEAMQLGVWLIATTLIVVAAAGPVRPDAPQHARSGSLQVVIVLDVSKSMAAEDYREVMPGPNGEDGSMVVGPHGSRLGMAKHVIINNIMKAIPGNQLGVVTYTGSGFPQAPLTDDFNALRWVLEGWVDVGNAPGGGSDYAEGLKEALATFERRGDPDRDKVIVVFSDGGFTGDEAALAEVSQEIVDKGIRVVVVGVGSIQPATIPVYKGDQLEKYLEKDGQVVTTSLQESGLISLAGQTGGEYIHLANEKDFQIEWVSTLAGEKAEPRESHVFFIPLAGALALILLLSARGIVTRKDTI